MKTAAFAALLGYAAAQQAATYDAPAEAPPAYVPPAPAYAPPAPVGYGSPAPSYACNPAHQYPDGQLCATVGGSLTLVTRTPAATAPGYGPSTTAATTATYACNPAHQYPPGQVCATVGGSLTLLTTSSQPTTSAYVDACQQAYKQCIAAGQPEVKCSCALSTCSGEDSARIRDFCATATANLPTTAAATQPGSYPTSTSSCAAPGTQDSQGRYSCNPAHQYPAGQTCQNVGGCPVLVSATTSAPSSPSSTPSCPAAGSTDSQGRYSCNPAHAYPEGQTCQPLDGCYFLVGTPGVYTTQVVTAITTYCPQPTIFTHGPTTYTITSATTLTLPCKGGCTATQPLTSAPPAYTTPIIVKPWSNTTVQQPPSYTTKVVTELTTYCPQPTVLTYQHTTYTVTKPATLTLPCQGGCTVTKEIPHTPYAPQQPSATPSCPAPGSTDKSGRYSCNPAHQYPQGQTCQLVDGCYYLVTPPSSSNPLPPSTYMAPPPNNPPAQPTTSAAPPPYGPVAPPVYPTQSSIVSRPSATFPRSSTTSLTPYTGAAASFKTGAPIMVAVAIAALFM